MGVKLIRSAYSTILREARDGSAGLMDRHGNTVAQAELIPMQLGPIGETLRACLRRHPVETLKEGDFLINNDPFEGGQHIPDVFIFTPIFVGRPSRGLRRLGGASPRSRRRRARPQHPRLATSTRKASASRPAATASSTTGTAAPSSASYRQCARARPHHRRLQRPVRRQRDRRVAGKAALRTLRRRQGRSGDEGDAGLLRAPRARRHRPGAQGRVLRRGRGRR